MKELLKLAEGKGYKPILCHVAKYGGTATLPHAVTDAAEEISELALIQQFLATEYKIFVTILLDRHSHPANPSFYHDTKSIKGNGTFGEYLTIGALSYHTPQEALKEGIFQALNLIHEEEANSKRRS